MDKENILDDVEVVEAFINGEYKSIYLMDSWMKIRDYIYQKEKADVPQK